MISYLFHINIEVWGQSSTAVSASAIWKLQVVKEIFRVRIRVKFLQSEPALFFLSLFSGVRRLRMKLDYLLYITSPKGKSYDFHRSTSEYATGCRLSTKLLDLWPWVGPAWVDSFLSVRSACRGTRLGAVAIFDGVFLTGAGVVMCFAAPPDVADPLPAPCFPPRVPLAATAAVNVSRSCEADPKRTCSSVSAASENIDRAPVRLLQESQHSLL